MTSKVILSAGFFLIGTSLVIMNWNSFMGAATLTKVLISALLLTSLYLVFEDGFDSTSPRYDDTLKPWWALPRQANGGY